MIKTYNPEKAYGKIHVIEATYMFDDTKVVVRQKIDEVTVGASILFNFTACDSDWLSDEYTLVEGELKYNEDEDTVIVTMNNGSKTVVEGAKLEDHLVKVEIVAVEELEGEEQSGK